MITNGKPPGGPNFRFVAPTPCFVHFPGRQITILQVNHYGEFIIQPS